MKRSGFKRKRWSKYGAIKTEVDGIVVDSRLEAEHYGYLKIQQIAGEIAGLELQKEFNLVVNDYLIGVYIADYFYRDLKDGRWVVSDAKGVETPEFKLKFKLCKALYPLYIYEIRQKLKIIRR